MPAHPSLWLLSDADTTARLSALHDTLRHQAGGPQIDPHLTLLGSIPARCEHIVDAARRLAAQIPPMTISVNGPAIGERYFRCVFLQTSSSEALLDARRAAIEALGHAPATAFVPHISLLYGTLSTERRQQLIAGLDVWPQTLPLRTLSVVRTIGPVAGWVEVERFPLSG